MTQIWVIWRPSSWQNGSDNDNCGGVRLPNSAHEAPNLVPRRRHRRSRCRFDSNGINFRSIFEVKIEDMYSILESKSESILDPFLSQFWVRNWLSAQSWVKMIQMVIFEEPGRSPKTGRWPEQSRQNGYFGLKWSHFWGPIFGSKFDLSHRYRLQIESFWVSAGFGDGDAHRNCPFLT